MSKRAAGIGLIAISAFLYGIRYISASLFGSNVQTWNEELFKALLESVGNGPVILSIIALVMGFAYLIWAEVENFLFKKR